DEVYEYNYDEEKYEVFEEYDKEDILNVKLETSSLESAHEKSIEDQLDPCASTIKYWDDYFDEDIDEYIARNPNAWANKLARLENF
ncbi:UNVERIFIED_CONTAM: hypothetical protein ITH36_25500, partial [Salmonella enterica subsp. enterica serovar Weltevreden]